VVPCIFNHSNKNTQLDATINRKILLLCRTDTAQHVSDIIMPIIRNPSNCRCSLWFPYECGGGSVLSRGRFVSPTFWAVSIRQRNKILRLIIASSWVFLFEWHTRISNKVQCYTVYFTWKLLYVFRVEPSPIIRRANNCIYSIWYLSHRYCYLPLSWKSWNRFECVVGGVRHTQTSSSCSTIAADINNVVINTRRCRYSCLRSW